MRLALLLLCPLVFVAATAPALAFAGTGTGSTDAAATPPPSVRLDVTAFDDGGRFAFYVDGHDGGSPDLVLQAGARVEVRLRNNGTVAHDWHLGAPVAAGTDLVAPGEATTFTFTVPRDVDRLVYTCTLHPGLGMRGAIAVAGGQAAKDAPAGGPLLAGAALTLAAAVVLLGAARRPPKTEPL